MSVLLYNYRSKDHVSNPAPVHPDPELPLPLGRAITPPLPLPPEFDGLRFLSASAGLCCCWPMEAGSWALLAGAAGFAGFCEVGC
jgi:hypothetical protein